ncbi:CDC27 family protein [Solibacillus sp. FSL R7-0682]|uniref:tetratricopeptide repeat protein n=1 Tax=Solibacillus sp. FSL R7-0682 TaxID=2921690 RepID=UPI0030F702FB
MMKKRNLKRHGNVVLFPGTIERMLEEARLLAENYQYQEANALFEKAFELTEGDEISLSVYAYSLYELKNYERAKEVCEKLLMNGPSAYFEVMELYLTVCMQLRQFKQVEKIIESLLDEEVIPSDQLEKFHRLKKLNAEIAQNQNTQLNNEIIEEDEALQVELDASHFLQLPLQQQLMRIHEITEINIRPYINEVKEIIEHDSVHPFIQSLLLILLVEQEVHLPITVSKFDQVKEINPAELDLPTKLVQFSVISNILLEQLEHEPSTLEFVQHLIAKHAIVLYPFEWLHFDSEDVAISYIDFVKMMFGEVKEMDYEIVEFLQNLEKITDLQE